MTLYILQIIRVLNVVFHTSQSVSIVQQILFLQNNSVYDCCVYGTGDIIISAYLEWIEMENV